MSIQDRFEEFHENNPQVYKGLVRLARRAYSRGHRRMGIELLFSVLRWETLMETTDAHSTYKLNDHYTSRYARLIRENEPVLGSMFAIRELRAA